MSSKNFAEQQKRVANHQKEMERADQRKKLRTAKKKMRRNQIPKKARRKNWMADEWDEFKAEYDNFERIMPRDEGERRRAIEQTAFAAPTALTEDAPEADVDIDDDTIMGLVVEVSKGLCRVQVDDRVLLCSLRGNLAVKETSFTNAIAVGDEVVVTEDGAGAGAVNAVLPRRSVLARPDPFYSHLQQVIVANVDQVLVVSSWREPHIWLELADRYLIVAARNDLPAILCVNKIDLLEDAAELDATMRPYRELGYTMVLTSTLSGAGIDQLGGLLAGQTTVLAGLSGVGKSSLISAVEPGLDLRTSHISDKRQEGRHTTTQATLLPLSSGGAVVDTPGIREFGLSGLYQSDLAAFMPDLAHHATGCRFSNCLHRDEPDCTVREAAVTGAVAESRYESYIQILETLPA